jgi:hypothetical protein
MTLVQLSAMSGNLLAANSATAVQGDIDIIQTMLNRWKNSYNISVGDYSNLEAMASKIRRHFENNPTSGRNIWQDFKVAQGWI